MSKTTEYIATYVHRRRRTTSGIFDADLHRKNWTDWELAAVFRVLGKNIAIRLPTADPDYRPSHLIFDRQRLTAKALLGGNLPESGAVTRVWSRPDTRRQKIDCFAVYRHRRSATALFDHGDSDVIACGPDLLLEYDLVAVFKVVWERDVMFRKSVVEVDDREWTAEELLNGEAEISGRVTLAWKRPAKG